ncbi:nucleoside recognition domain-containing protein [Halalkalicoccus tibetensis]|uniref:Nucleoside recognition domain-containing protein n=1 Tax=Halalkalicoccus tibetensis TaxID=175632 RepID=A0ABD5V6D9_9EURY
MGGETVVAVGAESVGKSTLVGALTGGAPKSGNVGGTTTAAERYEGNGLTVVDTPGVVLSGDLDSAGETLDALDEADAVLLVVSAPDLDDQLARLLPLVAGRRGAVAVTFWDKVGDEAAGREALAELEEETGVPFVPVDARELDDPALATDGGAPCGELRTALSNPTELPGGVRTRIGWGIEPPERVFERPIAGPLVALALLLLPAALAVAFANTAAGWLDPVVEAAFAPAVAAAEGLPSPLAAVLAGRFGLLSMGPFLLVWAGPTVVLFAFVLGAYTASGLANRVTLALHPLTRRVGLTGRDLVRVVMGFGCNVPAVTNTRGCSACTRCTTISAISFGAACSYQLPATLAVFAAAGMPWLVGPYLLVLAVSTLAYVRLIAPAAARHAEPLSDRAFLQWPTRRGLWREARGTLSSFARTAMPVFVAITLVASALDHGGVLERVGSALEPAMALFGLPGEAAVLVVFSSVRKDGIALFAAEGVAASLTPVEVLTAVYLAGVLLPCLVTALTVAREVSARFVAGMLARQAAAACAFAAAIAHGGALLLDLL